MEGNGHRLPGILLRELYRRVLQAPHDGQATAAAPKAPTPAKADTPETTAAAPRRAPAENRLGRNLKQVLVLVSYPDMATISAPDISFLTGILKACRLSMDDILLWNLAHEADRNHATLLREAAAKTVLLFGIPPADISLPVNFPENQPTRHGDVTYLRSMHLTALQPDEQAKRLLWGALKRIFVDR